MFAIKTKKLILRDLQESDWSLIHKLVQDKEIGYYMGDYITASTEEQAKIWIRERMRYNAEKPRHSFNLAIEKNGVAVGWIGIGEAEEEDKKDLDFGYALLREYWSNGIMTEALDAVIKFCFKNLSIKRITGDCEINNIGSRKVMEKVGMSLVKKLRDRNETSGDVRYKYRFEIIAV